MPAEFCDYSGKKLSISEVVGEMVGFMAADETKHYKIIVGSDSLQFNGNLADFVTAIVIHRVGNGGRYFWRRVGGGKFHTLRDRIIQEALFSIDAAKELLGLLENSTANRFGFEIHVDIGIAGETKTIIQEVTGIVRANNFEVRIKPESFAASKVADRHV